MTEQTWTGVRERVLRLCSAPGAEQVFGYHGHGFALAEPLTADELADLERWLGVRLPDAYREFLREVGAGGAGPAYGVFPVRRVAGGGWEWVGDGGNMTTPARLPEPFPQAGPDAELLDALEAERPDEADFESAEEYEEAEEAWWDRWETLMWSEDRTVGAICLCHIGCAERRWLVVSGPERGRIWADARCDGVDMQPLRLGPDDGTPATFRSWYLEWLERAERTTADAARTAEGAATDGAAMAG
ncbi:SMI1/KNR4 family protein [Streptomyces sp. NPDC048196]|uniref:SMI1/KNR4 family protein n=1 Tax=Streptomyces sp. NPDC048196 TaxID=3154712 RepID=UPI0033FB902B